MKLWRQRQDAKGKRKAVSNGIGSASLGDLSLSASPNDGHLGLPTSDSARSGFLSSSSSKLGFPSLGSQGDIAGPSRGTRSRAISAPKLRPKTWVSQLIAAANTATGDGGANLETTSEATARARAELSPRPVPVSTLVLSRDHDESDRAQAQDALRRVEAEATIDAGWGRRDSTSGASALSSLAHSQFSKSAPSLPLSNAIARYQSNGAMGLLPPLTPAVDTLPADRDPASPLVVRNLDEAPRGTFTPAIQQPSSTLLPGASRLRNPWEPRSDEDELVEEAVAHSRSTNQLPAEEEAILSMLESMGRPSSTRDDGITAPLTAETRADLSSFALSPASQYSTDLKSPTHSETSRFSQESGASNPAQLSSAPAGSVREAIHAREELDREASTTAGTDVGSGSGSGTGTATVVPSTWYAVGSALKKRASAYFSAVGVESAAEQDASAESGPSGSKADAAAVDSEPSSAPADTTATRDGKGRQQASSPSVTSILAGIEQRPPILSRQTSSAAHYDRGGSGEPLTVKTGDKISPAARGSVFAQMQRQESQRSHLELVRPSMAHRGSEFSTSSSLGGGLYGRPANLSGRLLSPTSPIDSDLLSSQGNLTSLWSRPTHSPDTPGTTYDVQSPIEAPVLSRWNSTSNGKPGAAGPAVRSSDPRPGYALDAGRAPGGSSILLAPRLRRQTTDWTDATSVTSGGADDDVEAKNRVRLTITATSDLSAASATDGHGHAGQEQSEVQPPSELASKASIVTSEIASRLFRRTLSRSESGVAGSTEASDGRRSEAAEARTSSVASRLSRQSASISVYRDDQAAAPLSPMPPSPTKAKDLIRFFETAGSPALADSPQRPSDSPSPSKASLRSVKKAFGESGNELDALQVTPIKLVFGTSNSNPNTVAARDSPFNAAVGPSPLAAKLRAGGVAGRSRLRPRAGGLLASGADGGGGLDGADDIDPSDEENAAPSLEATPARANSMARRRMSGSAASARLSGGSRTGLSGVLGGGSSHSRSGSTPTPLVVSATSSAVATHGHVGGLGYHDSMGRAAQSSSDRSYAGPPTMGSAGTPSGGNSSNGGAGTGGGGGWKKAAASGFPFRSSVQSIVKAFAGRGAVDEPNSKRGSNGDGAKATSPDKPKALKKAISTGWDYTKEPWEAQKAGADARQPDSENEDKDDAGSVASKMTLGTIASFKHTVERGDLPASASSAIELSGEPTTTLPVRSGVLFYFNVHQRDPHWQRVQVVLLPSAVAMSWIPAGGGRENVVLDLRACREVHSVPSPDHPSSTSDIGASCARKQGLGRLSPFQLIFDDGVERLAAESATERVKWVDSIWDVTGVSPKDRHGLTQTQQRPAPPDLSELRWPPPTSASAARRRDENRATALEMTQPAAASQSRPSMQPSATMLSSGTSRITDSPRRGLPASRSTNTVEAIDRIGSIWKSELSSDVETREHHPSIAEALGTGPPVPPKDPAAAKPPEPATVTDALKPAPAIVTQKASASSVLDRRQKVRSWRKKAEEENPAVEEQGRVYDSTAKKPEVIMSPEHKVKSQPASFADDRSENRTMAGSDTSAPKAGIRSSEAPATVLPSSRAMRALASLGEEPRRVQDDAASSRAANLDAPPEPAPELAGHGDGHNDVSPADTSPDLDGYESAHSHSSQMDEFGPRTPVSEAIFNWSRTKQDGDLRPSDSASQRPARSEYGTIKSHVSSESRQAKGAAEAAIAALATAAALEADLSTKDAAASIQTGTASTSVKDARTPAQILRDSVLQEAEEHAVTREMLARNEECIMANVGSSAAAAAASAIPQRLGTVIEETQSQAQSTRTSRQLGQTPILAHARGTSDVDEVIASSEVIRESLKSPSGESQASRRTNSSSYTQDVHRLLEHLETQQRAHVERERLMEDQIRGFQDVIAGLQTKKGGSSIRSKRSNRCSSASTSGDSRSTSRSDRDSELAAMQEKIDSLHDLVANMVTSQSQRNLGTPSGNEATSSELARIESMLQKLMRHSAASDGASAAQTERSRSIIRDAIRARDPQLVNEWDQLPPELRGAELMRGMEERARHGHDGRHEAIAHDMSGQHVRQGSAPPMAEDCGNQLTPRVELDTPRIGAGGLRVPSRASMANSVSMSELDSVAGRVPPRSWLSADGIPSPPPNSEWDAASYRSRRIFTPPTAGLHTPAQNLRIHGDPALGSTMPTPRPTMGPTQVSGDSLDMEAEIRKRRARQQASNGTGSAQPGGWYTPKVANGAGIDMANIAQEGTRTADGGRGAIGQGTPSVRWAPGGPARDPGRPKADGEETPSGLGLSLARNTQSGTFEGQRSGVGGDRLREMHSSPLDVSKLNISTNNPELAAILHALKQSEAARELQMQQQTELARYVNELHGWLEKDVAERSKEFRILATGVTQLHDEFLATKQASKPGSLIAGGQMAPPLEVFTMTQDPVVGPLTSHDMSRESSGQTATGTVAGSPIKATGMPIPIVTLGDKPIQIDGLPVVPNPHGKLATPDASSAPPALRPGGSAPAEASVPAVAAHIPFGNGGRWTNLQTPNLDNGFTTPARAKRPQTRTWHASAPAGPRKPEQPWYMPDDQDKLTKDKTATKDKAKRPAPLKTNSYGSAASSAASSDKSGKKLVAAAGGALLVRAALKEWEKFKAQQRAEGKPEDPIPAGASGNPELDKHIPLPEPIAVKLRQATEACDQEGVTRAVREAAQAGLGTQAIIKLNKDIEQLEGEAHSTHSNASDDARLDGETLMPTPSPRKTRFADAGDSAIELGNVEAASSSSPAEPMPAASPGGPSNAAVALAVEEILKHLMENKKEKKQRLQQSEAAKVKEEAERKKKEETQKLSAAQQKEAEKAELVDLILSRLNQEQARQEAEVAKKRSELDPKTAIESLVSMLNTQRESDRASQLEADRAIKDMASSLLRTTTEQNSKLVEAVNSAAREMLKHNVNAHADELKRTLTKEVAVMFEDVGKIREAKRALENEIADLFAIKSRHLAFDVHGNAGGMNLSMPMPAIGYGQPPPQIAMPQPQPQPWLPPHAYALNPYQALPPTQDGGGTKSKSAGGSDEEKKKKKKAKDGSKEGSKDGAAKSADKAAKPAAPAAVVPVAAVPAAVPGFLGGKDILNPFSINFGPRAPR